MRSRICFGILMLAAGIGSRAAVPARHDLTVAIDPGRHHLRVTDRVSLTGTDMEFQLNADLTIVESDPQVERISVEEQEGVRVARYRMQAEPPDGRFSITYEGTIDYGLSDQKEEYTRGFRETAGIIGDEGVYLDGSGLWYPKFNEELLEFKMTVTVPEGWHLISQGQGTSRGEDGLARWDSERETEEIYLAGGPLHLHRDQAGMVETLVYLRQPDDVLATKYLTAAAQYIEMYRELIGPYPYSKFAVVENFWETGYGMPSFTLLGPRVIRFPFILHSSLPHEILHNWWGNSVYVDYESGNWCEGLTAYMADHLIQEQHGKGADYRRGALQKYRDYVSEGKDFPLAEFRSRHSAATEAVGYGKSLMGFHMLRMDSGDVRFKNALADFYKEFRGKRASFEDLRAVFNEGGPSIDRIFDPWLYRAGAPSFKIEVGSAVELEDGRYQVKGTIEQVQEGDPFVLEIPFVVQTDSGLETMRMRSDSKAAPFEIFTRHKPLALHLDPYFDVFRLLDPRETPPSIGQIFGEERILALLPSKASDEELADWRQLIEGWQSDSHDIEVKLDSEVHELPTTSFWILGRNNIDANMFHDGNGAAIDLGGETVPFAGHSLVVIKRHPDNVEKAVGWLVVEPRAAFPGMARKLPHYGKYSYLAFEGDEPTNIVKGQWPATGSPLVVDLRPEGERGAPLPPLPAEPYKALAELPPVFSKAELAAHVEKLTFSGIQGRGLCGDGLKAAGDYIAEQFAAAGLSPGGDDGGWFQKFTVMGPQESCETANVVGYLPGRRDDWKEQSVVVGAHYDHLGLGWPDVHSGNEGRVHPGADDNASGVAVLLELAKNMASEGGNARNLVFVAFSGEEAGRLGSKYFVESSRPFPLDGIRGVINLDTVGRLFDDPLLVLGTGTASEWPHIFRGCGYVTGVKVNEVTELLDASDQLSFVERGIPGVQIFTGPHADYHRPSDTADKLDASGMVKVGNFVKEAVQYLVERAEPLTSRISDLEETVPPRPSDGSGRKVSFGVIPEFAYTGVGVMLSGVTPGSPAARAGLQQYDVLLRVDDQEIRGLRQFSDLLKQLEPGQTVKALVRRGEEILHFEVTVEER